MYASGSLDFEVFFCAHAHGGSMTSILLRNAQLVDPALDLDFVGDVLIENEAIALVSGEPISAHVDREIDCTDCVVSPGWIDMHVHLRVPGQEHKETIESGTAAAAAGGFTAIACMPNTEPALDSIETLQWLIDECRARAVVPVHPIGAITIARAGERLVDFAELAALGVVGFSDDGISTANSSLMMRALESVRHLNKPIMVHCEDPSLVGGVMNLGNVSRRLGVAGLAAAAEESFIARDCLLAHETGGWLHVLHVSSAIGLDLIRLARTHGARVTCEVMPHHLVMSDEWVAGDRSLCNTIEGGQTAVAKHPDTKVNPPLRTAADTNALLRGLANGDIDILATDHAPHAAHEKRQVPIENAAFGMIGLEVAIPAMLALVRAGHVTMTQVVNRFATQPARLWNLPSGSLGPGSPATLTVIDPKRRWTVTEHELRSKSKNTPLLGMELTGRAVLTMIEGKVVHDLFN
jgi:dihydroorotase